MEGGFRLNAEGRGLLVNALTEYLDRMKHHGRRRLKIRDTIVYECQRLAGRLLRGLDDDQEVDLSVFDLAAELGGEPTVPTSFSTGDAGSTDSEVAIDPAAVDEEAGDRKDDPTRRDDTGPLRGL